MRFLRFLALARLLRNRRRRPYGYPRSRGMWGGGYGRRRAPARGHVRVIGCGPGCLMTSLLLSIGLTILINIIIRLL